MARQISVTDANQERLAEIKNQESVCEEMESEVNHCKEELKAAKENYDAAVAHLRMLAKGEDRPLLEPDGE